MKIPQVFTLIRDYKYQEAKKKVYRYKNPLIIADYQGISM